MVTQEPVETMLLELSKNTHRREPLTYSPAETIKGRIRVSLQRHPPLDLKAKPLVAIW